MEDRSTYLDWHDGIDDAERNHWRLQALETYTYDERVKRAKRPEECDDTLSGRHLAGRERASRHRGRSAFPILSSNWAWPVLAIGQSRGHLLRRRLHSV